MNSLRASILGLSLLGATLAHGDGLVRPPVDYKGSLEERAQEAIIVFRGGSEKKSAVQDLILKISVEGTAERFAWIVPLPNPPKTGKADPKLFEELHRYVQYRSGPARAKYRKGKGDAGEAAPKATNTVEVISREVVGSYDVAVVREKVQGTLNRWLAEEGFQTIEGGEKLIESYRRKNYVFACVKVSGVTLAKGATRADLHPLRFTFETGGRDGIYFPMRITGLQKETFDVNLHVFYRAWLNDDLNKYGYTKQGFSLRHRDWDTRACKPNAGKAWWAPTKDPYLRDTSNMTPTVTKFFATHHHGAPFYLTTLQAYRLKPARVLAGRDLWLFPYYTDRSFVPFDMRKGGPAAD